MGQYELVTEKIIAQLEAGTRPWTKGWVGGGPGGRPRRAIGEPYRGINALWLSLVGAERGFSGPFWITYKGAADLGAQVRKGAKSEPAFYAGSVTQESDTGEERILRFMRHYRVFNADDVEGLPPHFYPVEPPRVQTDQPIPECEAFLAGTGAAIGHGGDRAFYRPATDTIQLPAFTSFRTAADYYSTAFHELAHWTGAKHRLGRELSQEKQAYAREELVAELAASFLCMDMRLEADPREDHAAYIAGWLTWLRSDSRAIFSAAAHAERAAQHLHGLRSSAEPMTLAA